MVRPARQIRANRAGVSSQPHNGSARTSTAARQRRGVHPAMVRRHGCARVISCGRCPVSKERRKEPSPSLVRRRLGVSRLAERCLSIDKLKANVSLRFHKGAKPAVKLIFPSCALFGRAHGARHSVTPREIEAAAESWAGAAASCAVREPGDSAPPHQSQILSCVLRKRRRDFPGGLGANRARRCPHRKNRGSAKTSTVARR
jgi:hypothetical protein